MKFARSRRLASTVATLIGDHRGRRNARGQPRQACTLALVTSAATPALAQAGGVAQALGGLSQAAAESVGHSVEGVAEGIAAGLSVVLAVPAAIGEHSAEAADRRAAYATRPLVIDDAVYTVGPAPGEALRHD